MTDKPIPLSPANLLRRLAALIYDAFLLFAITLAYGLLLLLIKVIFNGTQGLEEVQPGPILQWLSFAGWIVALAQLLLYMLAQTGPDSGHEVMAPKTADSPTAHWPPPSNVLNAAFWQRYHWRLPVSAISGV